MGISTSLVLIAVGAILKWAVTATTSGINLGTVGVVLMVVGAVGLLLSLIFWSSWGGVGGTRRRTTTYVEDGPVAYRCARSTVTRRAPQGAPPLRELAKDRLGGRPAPRTARRRAPAG